MSIRQGGTPYRTWHGNPRTQPPEVYEIIAAAGGYEAVARRAISKTRGKPMTRQAVLHWRLIPEEHCQLLIEMSGLPARQIWFAGEGRARFDVFAAVAKEAERKPW
jgi:hypothetical protein